MGAGGAEEASPEPVRPRYFTPTEVGAHNNPDDVWVSFLGGVYDLTPLSANGENGVLLQPLLDVAGTDISHWFDASTGDLKRSVDPVTNLEGYHVPMGRFVHVPPADPSADWSTSFGTPWWKNAGLRVGDLTACTRLVRIKNVLTAQEATLEVPEEETVGEIRERYLVHNWHAKGYTWKVMKRTPPEDGAEEATGACSKSARTRTARAHANSCR